MTEPTPLLGYSLTRSSRESSTCYRSCRGVTGVGPEVDAQAVMDPDHEV